MQIVPFASLTATGQYFSCELSQYNPPGGCSGNLGWTQFMSGVDALHSLFETSAYTVIYDTATGTFVNTSVNAIPDPSNMCRGESRKRKGLWSLEEKR
jgi:hypothetical protein